MKIEKVRNNLQSTFTFVFILNSKIQDAATELIFIYEFLKQKGMTWFTVGAY